MATQTFSYTGAVQTWVVPNNVYKVTIECWGAQGGGSQGGKGGYAKGTLDVTPGETLRAYVGGRNDSGTITGGWNGGGNSGGANLGRPGGGASDVRQGGTALSARKIVGAGGAGHSSQSANSTPNYKGGRGGAVTGERGSGPSTTGGSGHGGSQSAGGTGGGQSGLGFGAAGTLGNGGNGAAAASRGGGGGGGGFYGGGGGGPYGDYAGGGGGGSNYIGGVKSGSTTRGVRVGNGLIKFTWEVVAVPGTPVISEPSGEVTQTDTPTVAWTSTNGDAGVYSYFHAVHIYPEDVYTVPGFDPITQPGDGPIYSFTRSNAASPSGSVDILNKVENALPNGNYRMYVRVAKQDVGAGGQDVFSNWGTSDFSINVMPAGSPVISSPSGEITDTDRPQITWTVPNINEGIPETWQEEIKVFTDDVYNAPGFDPTTELDFVYYRLNATSTGRTQYDPSGDEQMVDALDNGTTYRVYVRVAKNGLLASGPLWSEWAYSEFNTNFTVPNAPTLLATAFQSTVRNRLTWSWDGGPTVYDEAFLSIERRGIGEEWEYVRGVREVPIDATGDAGTIYDNEAKRDKPYYYRATIRASAPDVDSFISNTTTLVYTVSIPTDGMWWLKSIDDPALKVALESEGTTLPMEHEVSSASFSPLGRESFVTVFDVAKLPKFSHTFGTLDQATYDSLKALWKSGHTLLLQAPHPSYGDYYVAVDNPVQDDLVNPIDPYHRVTIRFMPAAKPEVAEG